MTGAAQKPATGSTSGTNVLIRKGLRWLEILAQGLAIGVLVLWIGDWGMFRVRSAHGSAFQSVEVQEFLSTPMKNGRPEYDYMGVEEVPCVRAIFPHAHAAPCWWVRRHRTEWE